MANVAEKTKEIDRAESPFMLENHSAYNQWRAQKLTDQPSDSEKLIVEVCDMMALSDVEIKAMCSCLNKTNMVVYSSRMVPHDAASTRVAIRSLAVRFRLDFTEAHRSAGEEELVALEVTAEAGKRGYIPYSNKPLNWHTDGYYNQSGEDIGTFILHCARNAPCGGVNQLLDPEIAYIRLRDKNPGYIEALSHPEAMTIPFNIEDNGTIRPDSIGPVFKILPDGSGISMRYTARTRSISWRDDKTTQEAVAFLNHLLKGSEPMIHTVKLQPGQGLINNNVLHNRSGFTNGATKRDVRLFYRIRFHQRIKCNSIQLDS